MYTFYRSEHLYNRKQCLYVLRTNPKSQTLRTLSYMVVVVAAAAVVMVVVVVVN